MIKMNRNFSSVILGDKFFSINANGDLVEDVNGETGIDFLYENFDKINFADDEKDKKSFNRRNKVSILKQLGREKVFVNKWLIIPPFYRDIDLSSKDIISADELSTMYKKLIGITNTINPSGITDFLTGNITEYKVQALLNEIYIYLTSKLSKKTGIIQKNLLGKSVDYAVRAVISGPKLNSNTHTDLEVPYGYVGIPLHLLTIAFFPFVLSELERFFIDFKNDRLVVTSSGQEIEVIDDTISSLSSKSFERLINFYSRSHEGRATPVKILTATGETPIQLFKDQLNRDFTITDLLYIILSEIIKDKHVYLTRYPTEDYRNVVPLMIKIITTETTISQNIYSTTFPNYPNLENGASWVDSVKPNNSYLAGLGGDYDGDTVSIRGVYTKEANEEAAMLIKSKMTLLDGAGKASRIFSKEGTLSLYNFTM
jgi:DNA-directed RNA polymerase beta' subunit